MMDLDFFIILEGKKLHLKTEEIWYCIINHWLISDFNDLANKVDKLSGKINPSQNIDS